MSDIAIRAEQLSKSYQITHSATRGGYKTLQEDLLKLLKRPLKRNTGSSTRETFWALKEISFEVKYGEVLGIIGRNGAGKSTLLKILSRITKPTSGRADIYGRVGSLLEVGTGFHPELTGRENIFLNGAILGMSRRGIQKHFDEIVAFAEIEQFLDTPVKRYSSGMYMRLAFAVAAHLEPEVLVVDEVLAVGDAKFQEKCLGKMSDVAKSGRTVLFVSHNMGAVAALCPTSLWLDKGQVQKLDQSATVIQEYLSTSFETFACVTFPAKPDKKAQILQVRLLDDAENETTNLPVGSEPTLEVTYILRERVQGIHIACILTTASGFHVFSTADTDSQPELFGTRTPGEYVTRVKLPLKPLNTGVYHVAVGIGIPNIELYDRQEVFAFTLHDTGDFGTMKDGSRRQGLLLVNAPWNYLA